MFYVIETAGWETGSGWSYSQTIDQGEIAEPKDGDWSIMWEYGAITGLENANEDELKHWADDSKGDTEYRISVYSSLEAYRDEGEKPIYYEEFWQSDIAKSYLPSYKVEYKFPDEEEWSEYLYFTDKEEALADIKETLTEYADTKYILFKDDEIIAENKC